MMFRYESYGRRFVLVDEDLAIFLIPIQKLDNYVGIYRGHVVFESELKAYYVYAVNLYENLDLCFISTTADYKLFIDSLLSEAKHIPKLTITL